MRHLSETLEDVDALNVWHGDQALRTYQHDIIRNGLLNVRDPGSGARISATAHYYKPLQGCIYWFPAATPFCLVSGTLHFGYPIIALVTAETVQPIGAYGTSALIAVAQDLLTKEVAPGTLCDASGLPRVFLGHPNFAHYIWNEFPALSHLSQEALPAQIVSLYDPLGLTGTFCEIRGLPFTQTEDPATLTGWQDVPTCMIGAEHCSAETMDLALNVMGLPATRMPDTVRRIYVSVRKIGRTMENQQEFLTDLLQGLFAEWSDLIVVIDGFTVPVDYDRQIYASQRKVYDTRIADAKEVVACITSALPAAFAKRVHDITGVSLAQSLREIARCRYYVTHPGTQQHKAGWFYDLPGTIHGNAASISPSSLRWHGQKVGGRRAPKGVLEDCIEDLDVLELSSRNKRNVNYRVTDVPQAIAALLADIRSCEGESAELGAAS